MSNIRNFFLRKTFLVLGNLVLFCLFDKFFWRKSMKETKYNNRGYFINSFNIIRQNGFFILYTADFGNSLKYFSLIKICY